MYECEEMTDREIVAGRRPSCLPFFLFFTFIATEGESSSSSSNEIEPPPSKKRQQPEQTTPPRVSRQEKRQNFRKKQKRNALRKTVKNLWPVVVLLCLASALCRDAGCVEKWSVQMSALGLLCAPVGLAGSCKHCPSTINVQDMRSSH